MVAIYRFWWMKSGGGEVRKYGAYVGEGMRGSGGGANFMACIIPRFSVLPIGMVIGFGCGKVCGRFNSVRSTKNQESNPESAVKS